MPADRHPRGSLYKPVYIDKKYLHMRSASGESRSRRSHQQQHGKHRSGAGTPPSGGCL